MTDDKDSEKGASGMQDKDIMHLVMDMEERLTAKLDKGFAVMMEKFSGLPCSGHMEKNARTEENLSNLEKEFNRYATVHDNFHRTIINRWRWVMYISLIAVTAMATALGVVVAVLGK